MAKPHVYQGSTVEVMSFTADESSIYELLNLSTLTEALGFDAYSVKIHSINVIAEITSISTLTLEMVGSFGVIQTAQGSLTEGHYPEQIISNVLEDACSDEVGFSSLTPTKLVEIANLAYNVANATLLYKQKWGFQVPARVLRLLEKEGGTEHEQDISICFIGYSKDTTTFNCKSAVRIEFTRAAKDISIR